MTDSEIQSKFPKQATTLIKLCEQARNLIQAQTDFNDKMQQARIKYNNAKEQAQTNRAKKKDEIVTAQNILFNKLMATYFTSVYFIRNDYSTNSSNMNNKDFYPYYKHIINQFERIYKNYN